MKTITSLISTAALVTVLTFITSCRTANFHNEDNNGFLADYSTLKANNNNSDTLAWQWHDKNIPLTGYRALHIEPLVFYPEPQSSSQVSKDILLKLQQSTDAFLRETASKQGVPLVAEKGPQVLILRSAITSAKVKLKGFSLIELIPVHLAFSGAELALGKRDRDFELVFEYELIDSVTNKAVFRGVQYAPNIMLENNKEQINNENTQLLLEKIISYLERNFKTLAKQLNK